MKSFLFNFLIIVLTTCFTYGQRVLPKHFSKYEKEHLKDYTVPINRNAIFTPPNNEAIRTPAEWESMQGVAISWVAYSNFLSQIVRYAQEEGRVYIYCEDSLNVKTYLSSKNIGVDSVIFIQQTTNSVWIRDYGANNIYLDEVGELAFVDWVYNRNRPQDDISPEYLAQKLGVPIYATTQSPVDLVNTGGNFMCDGLGNAFASKLIMDENESINAFNSTPKTEAEVDKIMLDYMNITRYVKMPTLPYDGIHHIDMHMKLLDEETLLVGEYPDGVADGPQIEQNLQYISDHYLSAFNTPYKIVRIPMPIGSTWSGYEAYPDEGGTYRTYTNSLILNKKVLVPIYNIASDSVALNIYKQQMPAYEIIGINAEAPIQASGAIHCTTHEIAEKQPIWMVHQKLSQATYNEDGYEIKATIKHISGIQNASVYYKDKEDDEFTQLPMKDIGNDNWRAIIPSEESTTIYEYYIEAQAFSGKTRRRPLSAPNKYWSFTIEKQGLIQQENQLFKPKYYIQDAQIVLYYQSDFASNINVTLYNIQGQMVVAPTTFNTEKGLNLHRIPVNHLTAGVYVLKIHYGKHYYSKKIIISSCF